MSSQASQSWLLPVTPVPAKYGEFLCVNHRRCPASIEGGDQVQIVFEGASFDHNVPAGITKGQAFQVQLTMSEGDVQRRCARRCGLACRGWCRKPRECEVGVRLTEEQLATISAAAAAKAAEKLKVKRENNADTCARYRINLQRRAKAGDFKALGALNLKRERERKKAEKRNAERALARALAKRAEKRKAPAAPAPPPKKKQRYVCEQSVDEQPIAGQCEGITKEGKRCCVHRDISVRFQHMAWPLQAGGRFCSRHDPAVFTGTQCAAIKKNGERCRVFSGAAHADARPLRTGQRFCVHHARWPMLRLRRGLE